MTAREIRVAIADDEEIVRAILSRLLAKTSGMRLVAAVEDGAAAVALVRTGAVDVLVLDIEMPGMNGEEALRIIRAVAPSVRVVMHSSRPASKYEAQMLEQGATAYLQKPCDWPILIAAIRNAGDSAGGDRT